MTIFHWVKGRFTGRGKVLSQQDALSMESP